jgi:hypothetical protein
MGGALDTRSFGQAAGRWPAWPNEFDGYGKIREMTKVEIHLPPISVILAADNEQAYIEPTVSSILKNGSPVKRINATGKYADREICRCAHEEQQVGRSAL